MRTPTPILALTLALFPSLAVAGPLVITRDTKVSTYRPFDGARFDLNGFRLDGKDLIVERGVLRAYKDNDSNTVVRNATFSLVRPATGSNLPVALEYRAGSNHLIENVIAKDFRMVPREKHYENGDCFSGEYAASRITFRNTTAQNCSDGGYDFKSKDVRFENATAIQAGKSFRIWGSATASTLVCQGWRFVCLQTNPGAPGVPATFVVDKLHLEQNPGSKAYTFDVWQGSTLTVKSCTGKLGDGKVMSWQKGATPSNTDVTLCGVKVANQSDAQLRAEIEAKIAADATSVPAAVAAPLKPRCTFPMKLADRSGNGVITLGTANAAKCGGKANMKVKLLDERPGQYVYGPA